MIHTPKIVDVDITSQNIFNKLVQDYPNVCCVDILRRRFFGVCVDDNPISICFQPDADVTTSMTKLPRDVVEDIIEQIWGSDEYIIVVQEL